jgi:hypothetical protein
VPGLILGVAVDRAIPVKGVVASILAERIAVVENASLATPEPARRGVCFRFSGARK